MTSATQTVFFTDLAGYTERVARSDRDGLRRILKEHEQRVVPIVQRYGGRVVKNIGDSFLCLFGAATDGLRAALDIQQLKGSEADLQLRVALNTGDVEMIEGDVFGDAVNLASRILSHTPAGEIRFGVGTRACMNAAEIPWEAVGAFRFKGVPGEQPCYRVVPDDRAWLPQRIVTAAKEGRLVRIVAGARKPLMVLDPIVLFEGFTPGSAALEEALDSLPVLDQAALYLAIYRIAMSDREAWTELGRGLVVGTPAAIDASIVELQQPNAKTPGADTGSFETVLLGRIEDADLDVVVAGLALPAVPFAGVVAGYYYDLLPDGTWVTHSDRSILRVEVAADKVVLHVRGPEITVAGTMVAAGETVVLSDPVAIGTPAGAIWFEPLAADYVGVLLRDTDKTIGVRNGQTVELGRKPVAPGLSFPSREGQQNIRWCPGPRAKLARAQHFTLDRGLVGRRQMAVKPDGNSIEIIPLHEECATYLLRDDRFERIRKLVRARFGDMIVAGTTVVALRRP